MKAFVRLLALLVLSLGLGFALYTSVQALSPSVSFAPDNASARGISARAEPSGNAAAPLGGQGALQEDGRPSLAHPEGGQGNPLMQFLAVLGKALAILAAVALLRALSSRLARKAAAQSPLSTRDSPRGRRG